MKQSDKTVWYWANGEWCDSTPGRYTALSLKYGCHMGVVDVGRFAPVEDIDFAVLKAIICNLKDY